MIGPVAREGDAPAVPAALGLVAGILAGSLLTSGAHGAGALLFAAGAWAALLSRRPARRGSRGAALALVGAAAGLLSGWFRIAAPDRAARASLSSGAAGAADRIEGTLADFWSGSPPRARARLASSVLERGGVSLPFPGEVSLFVGGEARAFADRGDRVAVVGRLRPEDLPASERDLELPWVRYRMTVKSALLLERRGATLGSWLTLPNRFLFRSIPVRDATFERDVRGPLAALLLGRTSELDRGMVARYRRGGLYHLLVVSGLHVALAAGLVFALLSVLGVRGKPRDAALLAAVFAIVLVGGANPPAVRAGLVFAVFLAARLLERPIRGAQAAALSALVLFLAAPREVYSLGCALTFAAVIGIALFAPPIRARLPPRPDWLFSGLATALGAEIATAPILLWRFNLLALGAWITAPLSIPLSGALIALGGLLLAAFAFGVSPAPLVALFAAGVRFLEWTAERASGVALLRPTPPLAACVAVEALLLAAALLPRPRLRAGSALLSATLFLWLALRAGPAGPRRGFSLEALDVGQGDAILLRWGRHAMLVDGGGPFDLDAREFGRTRLVPKLLDRGVTRLDALLLTHPHPDHALGLFAVADELTAGRVWVSAGEDESGFYAALRALARRRGIPFETLEAGPRELAGARLSVLQSGGPRRKRDPVNEQSVVMVFEKDGRRALLTGDAGAAAEDDLQRAGALSPVDVLKVGHHGSRSGTTAAFLDAVCPRLAVVSCGRENRFGHPSPATLAALAVRGIRLFRTDVSSDVRVELRPEATRLRLRGLP